MRGSLEHRILELLSRVYPITTEDIRRELHVSQARVDRSLKALAQRGVVELDILPDKVYVRLLVTDLRLTRARGWKHRTSSDSKDDYEGIAYR